MGPAVTSTLDGRQPVSFCQHATDCSRPVIGATNQIMYHLIYHRPGTRLSTFWISPTLVGFPTPRRSEMDRSACTVSGNLLVEWVPGAGSVSGGLSSCVFSHTLFKGCGAGCTQEANPANRKSIRGPGTPLGFALFLAKIWRRGHGRHIHQHSEPI